MTSLIVTADDFGLATEVNEAVEIAHTRGILTAASLMVGAPAVDDAVARALRMPSLAVGLHLVLVDGRPVLPAREVPDLVDESGRFRNDMVRSGLAIFSSRRVQRQIAAEIEAQFAAFAATGLVLDHVNAHKHFHLHPTIGRLVVAIGGRYGMQSVRVPQEPLRRLRRLDPTTRRVSSLWPFTALLRRRLTRCGLQAADAVIGCAWSGGVTVARVVALLEDLPPGRIELYLHPATADRFAGSCSGYAYAAELESLVSPRTLDALRTSRVGHPLQPFIR